jgi:hypothetical protein
VKSNNRYVVDNFLLGMNSIFISQRIASVAIIRPVAKVGTPSGLSDSRPISIFSVLSKAFERILHDQVLEHVNAFNLLSES